MESYFRSLPGTGIKGTEAGIDRSKRTVQSNISNNVAGIAQNEEYATEYLSGMGNKASPIYASEIGSKGPQVSLDKEDIVKGIIYSEILSPPKSKRTGRQRNLL